MLEAFETDESVLLKSKLHVEVRSHLVDTEILKVLKIALAFGSQISVDVKTHWEVSQVFATQTLA